MSVLPRYAFQSHAVNVPERSIPAWLRDGKVQDRLAAVSRLVRTPMPHLGGFIVEAPAWVQDESKWDRAKKAVDPDSCDDYWACVTTVYKNMGGRVKKKSSFAWIYAPDGIGLDDPVDSIFPPEEGELVVR